MNERLRVISKKLNVEDALWSVEVIFLKVMIEPSAFGAKVWNATTDTDSGSTQHNYILYFTRVNFPGN